MSSSVNWKHLGFTLSRGLRAFYSCSWHNRPRTRLVFVTDNTTRCNYFHLYFNVIVSISLSGKIWTQIYNINMTQSFLLPFTALISLHHVWLWNMSPYFVVIIISYFTVIMFIDDEISIAVNIITNRRSTCMFLLIKPPLERLSRIVIYL